MPEEKIVLKCDICGSFDQHGPHRYEGHRLELYGDVRACDTCWEGNHDGWAPRYKDVVLAHLKRQGLPVSPCNGKGFFPRD